MAGTKRTCIIEGCDNPHKARGYCSVHHRRLLRSGELLPIRRNYFSVDEAIANRTEWRGDCLVWTGAKNPDGYGLIRQGGVHVIPHRYAWERSNGPIPDGMYIDHICWNRACINPDHLRLATHSQNSRYLSGVRKNGTTGVRGVFPNGRGFVVRIQRDGKLRNFGTYSTIEEAAEVAERERERLFGDFAGRGKPAA